MHARIDTRPIEDLDRVVHEPARLMILAQLCGVETGNFNWLLYRTNLTTGNLSFHIRKLADAGYVTVEKLWRNQAPWTVVRLTLEGRKALDDYRRRMLNVIYALPI